MQLPETFACRFRAALTGAGTGQQDSFDWYKIPVKNDGMKTLACGSVHRQPFSAAVQTAKI